MRAIKQVEIEDLIFQARRLPRKRTIFRLNEHEETVQRLVNALIPGTYIPPHKHENPDKVELLSILKGKLACIQFNQIGEVEAVLELDEEGPIKIVDIAPRTYHTVIALEPCALLEIIQGPYVEATHKNYASWAPREDSPKANDYLIYLTSIVDNWKKSAVSESQLE